MSEQDTQANAVSSGSAESSGHEADNTHKWKKTELTDDDHSFMKTVVERIEGVDISKFSDCWAEIGQLLNQEGNELPLGHCIKQFKNISEYLKDYSDYNLPYAKTFMQIYENISQTVERNQKALAQKLQPQMTPASASGGSLPGRRESPLILSIPEAGLPSITSPRVLSGSSDSGELFPDTKRPEAQEHPMEVHDSSANANYTSERIEIWSDQHGRTLSMQEDSLEEQSMILGDLPGDAPTDFARRTSLEGGNVVVSDHGKTLSPWEERLRKRRWNPETPADAPASSDCPRSLQERHIALAKQHGKTLSPREARLWKQRGKPEHPADAPASSTHLTSSEERPFTTLNQYDRAVNSREEGDIPGEYPVDVPEMSALFTALESRLVAVLNRHGSTMDEMHKLLKEQKTDLESVGKQLEEIKIQIR